MSDERMEVADVFAELHRVHLIVPFILSLRLEELGREFEIVDTVGPLFEPSAWMRNRKDRERNQAIVKALWRAQKALREQFPPPELLTLTGNPHREQAGR